MEIPFIGGAYAGRSLNLNAQVCQNLYPIVDKEGGKTVLALMNTPGLKFFASAKDTTNYAKTISGAISPMGRKV